MSKPRRPRRKLSPFGEQVDTWRLQARIRTVGELARRMNMPGTSVSRLMRQSEVPTVDTLNRLAMAVGVDIEVVSGVVARLFPLSHREAKQALDSNVELKQDRRSTNQGPSEEPAMTPYEEAVLRAANSIPPEARQHYLKRLEQLAFESRWGHPPGEASPGKRRRSGGRR